MKDAIRFLFCWLVVLIGPMLAQQTDVNRYTVFTGFDYMISPARNLTERGFDVDAGVTVKPWLGLGGDFGALGDAIISGAGTINGSETVYAPAVDASGLVPGGASSIHVAFRSTTYTFAAGPQFYWRRWKRITLLGRPGFGGIHEKADITFPSALIPLFTILKLPPPSPQQTDTELFFGLGGGVDVNFSRKVAVRFATDWVNTHLFSNLLVPRQNYVRFSIGPSFRWGHLNK
jgi:opacity protein-like surface antigen